MATVTAEIRKIVREAGLAGSYEMWTNKYAKTRTVKVGIFLNNQRTKDLVEQVKDTISKRLEELGVFGYSFKIKDNRHISMFSAFSDSFIVTVPRDDV